MESTVQLIWLRNRRCIGWRRLRNLKFRVTLEKFPYAKGTLRNLLFVRAGGSLLALRYTKNSRPRSLVCAVADSRSPTAHFGERGTYINAVATATAEIGVEHVSRKRGHGQVLAHVS